MKFIFLLFVLGMSSISWAQVYPELTDFVSQNISRMDSALTSADAIQPMDLGGNYEFKRIFLRLQARGGFNIEAATMTVQPELELVWEKDPKAK